MHANKLVFAVAAMAVLLIGTARVEAGWPWGCGYRSYSGYTQDYIPYFAKHPPVYYSYPVARPYGFSPYAYPPTVATPGPTRPLVVKNTYVADRGTARSSSMGPEPLRIVNPFVGDAMHQTVPSEPRTPDLPLRGPET